MSVLIKGMEMPKKGYVDVRLFAEGRATTQTGTHPFYKEMPIISLPPHGRLIDADKIGLTDFEIILCQKGNPFKNALEMLFEKINNAPTIIPASEEGES